MANDMTKAIEVMEAGQLRAADSLRNVIIDAYDALGVELYRVECEFANPPADHVHRLPLCVPLYRHRGTE